MKYLNTLYQNSITEKCKSLYFSKKTLNVPEQPIDNRDWLIPSSLTLAGEKNISSKEFSLRSSTPPVKNQGSIGSCVGHSGRVVYGFAKEFNSSEPSPMWIYKTGKKYDPWPGENYSGTTIRGAAQGLLKEGCCEEKFWPYTGKEDAPKLEGAESNADKFKINGYYVIPKYRASTIKKMLLKEPLWTSIMVRKDFFKVPSFGENAGVVDSKKYLASDAAGGHAVAMVGWRYIGDKLYWEFQNSWGSWFGDKGFFFMEDSLYQSVMKNSIGPY